tara:strand:- start:26884 stop:29688 length:2805 start_codon:yes stop_codon:yes gene_type:complete
LSFLNGLHKYYNGAFGGSGTDSALPLQTISEAKKYKKDKEFFKQTLDALETIGLTQFFQNLEFQDYYKMIQGDLVHRDFLDDGTDSDGIYKGIKELREEVQLPTYIKHYDLLGMIVNQLTGELPEMTDIIRMRSIDEYAKNDYIREKETLVAQYMQQMFNNNLNKLLALKGINPLKNDFQSEEEKQQYLQYLEEEKAKIKSPKDIDRELSKSWKVRAVEWAENKYESDSLRFKADVNCPTDETEMKDLLLTGRFFTNYHVGYDYYRPERWNPIQTFFSRNLDIKNPQDGDYVGRIHFMSASEIVQKWGHLINKEVQEDLHKVYDNYTDKNRVYSDSKTLYQRPVGKLLAPDEDYLEREINLQIQEAFQTPMGETTIEGKDGSLTKVPTWLSDYNDSPNYISNDLAKQLRQDIEVRHDVFRVTEAYWKGFKCWGALRYESEEGIIVEELVTEYLLSDFLKEKGIKKVNNVSLDEFEKDPERINQICYFYLPVIYQGKKIAGTGTSKDIYFDIKECDIQIKGDSNLYDLKLPVAGLITNSLGKKIRPYQLGYNVCLNQIYNLLEKELGMFFAMDINLLPSEYKDEGDSRDALASLRDTIRDIGILPLDYSKQNTAGTNMTMNTFQAQSLTFDVQIQRRIELAEYYKRLAFEQIGITEQRKGAPNEYMTNEGIKVGQEASYAQTKNLYTEFNNARLRKIELHLAIAQYCEVNDKDISTFYRKTDGSIVYNTFSDEKFHLRKIGVLPSSNSDDKKRIEAVKQALLNNNTFEGADVLSYANIINSDTLLELLDTAKADRKERYQREDLARQSQEKQTQMALEAEERKDLRDKAFEKMLADNKNETSIQESIINSLGRASDKKSDTEGINQIKIAGDQALKEQELDSKDGIENRKLDLKAEEQNANIAQKAKELEIRLREVKAKEDEIKTNRFTSIINKN